MPDSGNRKNKITRRKFLSLSAGIAGACACNAFLVEPEWLKVKRIKITTSGKAKVQKLRLVHFTDFHYKGDAAFAEKVIRTINDSKPDLVFFTGDLVEDRKYYEPALGFLMKIEKPLYGIPGNHDYWAGCPNEVTEEKIAQQGGRWLVNKSVFLPEHDLQITGCREDYLPQDVEYKSGARQILLSHFPIIGQQTNRRRFDLVLCGHSHGGQIRLPFIGPLIVPYNCGPYNLGLYDTPAGPLNVSGGIGNFLVRARFMCRPEITIVDFE